MFIRVLIYLLLLRSGLAAAEMEVTAQRSFVNALAEIWASGGSLLDRQDMGLEDQLIGNQSVSTNSQARSENVSISVESQASFTRSNTAEGIQFWIDAAVRIRSEGDLRTIGTNSLQTKGFGQSDNSIRISSSVPFRYDFRTWPQSPPLLTTLNGFYLTRTGHPVVQLQWDSAATELPRTEGRLPAGEYDIQFYSHTLAEGALNPVLSNPANGISRSTMSLAITPESAPEIPPVLRIRRTDPDRVVLEFSQLTPGTHYLLERSSELVPGRWSIVPGFTAVGSEAAWAEMVTPGQRAFYRFRSQGSN